MRELPKPVMEALDDLGIQPTKFSEARGVNKDRPVSTSLNFDQVWQDMQNIGTGILRSMGLVAPSQGVTAPIQDTSQEALDEMKKSHRQKRGQEAVSPNYAKKRYEFLRDREGFKRQVYQDHKGYRTIGVGFNMDAKGARKRWAQALPDVDFDEVLKGERMLTEPQVRRLFDVTIKEYEDIIDNKFKDVPLAGHQRMALVSLAFNSPSLIGPKLTQYVKNGDWERARDEILFRSNRNKHFGLQARRVLEAQLFAGAESLDADTLKRAFDRTGRSMPEWMQADLEDLQSNQVG